MTTFRDKMSIVAELTRGITPEFLAELHHTTEEEINQIAANHKVIVEVGHYMNISQGLPLLTGHYPVMENILFCWWSDHGNVKNKTLSEKARQIIDITGERPKFSNAPVFTGTMNWIRRFKGRFRHHLIEQSQTVSDDADMQTDPVLLSVDEIKMEMEFESETETLQSQNFDEETSTLDEQAETVTSRIQPGNNTEFVTSSPEEVIESELSSKRDGEIESSQVDDHEESSILTEQKPSTAADEKEILSSEKLVNSSGKNFRKRKSESIDERPTKHSNGNRTTDSNTDEDSSSQDFDDSVPIKKRRPKSEKILVQTKAGVKSVNFKDYKEGRVIRMFKPLLKFAKDNQWTPEDCDQLNKLYRKSLLSCGGKETKQLTITTFFRKKK